MAQSKEERLASKREWNRAWYARNKKFVTGYMAKWRQDNKARVQRQMRQAALKNRYGLTVAEYESLRQHQDGRCAICQRRRRRRLVVDHDHETRRVRGLLCYACNTALGLLDEQPGLFARAVAYLKGPKWPTKKTSPKKP